MTVVTASCLVAAPAALAMDGPAALLAPSSTSVAPSGSVPLQTAATNPPGCLDGLFCLGGVGAFDPPHAPILIVGDADFTAANGVRNPVGCGTSVNPCRIEDWSISSAPGGTCIHVNSTTKYYLIRNNSCTGGMTGILLVSAPNGDVRCNRITRLRARDLGAVGISVQLTNNVMITENRLSDMEGTAEFSGSSLDAFGILVGFGPSNVTIERNTISHLIAAPGRLGGLTGTGNGDPGGNAAGIVVPPPLLSNNVTIEDNLISQLLGGSGGAGAIGRNGGEGGSAFGIFATGDNVSIEGNGISLLFAGVGGMGGAGGLGGNGGAAGPGGSAYGIRVEDSVGVSNVSNTIFQLYGASGGLGGFAGFGGTGGNGGNGGNGIGISLSNVVGFINSGNIITFFFAGLGGFGAFPGGTNGTPGLAAAILST